MQSLRESLVSSHHRRQLLRATFCPFINPCGCHRRCLSSVWSPQRDFLSYTLCRFCLDFQLGLIVPACLTWIICIIGKPHTGNISAAMIICPSCSSNLSEMIRSRKMLKRVGDKSHSCLTPTVVLNNSPLLRIHLDCICSLVVELFIGAN